MYDGSLEVQLYYEQFIICREWQRSSLPWLICHHLIFLHFILQTEISSQRMIKMFFGLGHIIWKNKQRLEETFLLNAAFALFHNMLPYKRVLYLSISLHLPIVIVLMVQHKDFGDQKILYYVPLSKIMMCKSFSSDHFTILFTIAKGVKNCASLTPFDDWRHKNEALLCNMSRSILEHKSFLES